MDRASSILLQATLQASWEMLGLRNVSFLKMKYFIQTYSMLLQCLPLKQFFSLVYFNFSLFYFYSFNTNKTQRVKRKNDFRHLSIITRFMLKTHFVKFKAGDMQSQTGLSLHISDPENNGYWVVEQNKWPFGKSRDKISDLFAFLPCGKVLTVISFIA